MGTPPDDAPGDSQSPGEGESTRDLLVHRWKQLVRGEYLETPGLLLTRRQIQHLWGLDDKLCDEVLRGLIEERFLRRTDSGVFVQRL